MIRGGTTCKCASNAAPSDSGEKTHTMPAQHEFQLILVRSNPNQGTNRHTHLKLSGTTAKRPNPLHNLPCFARGKNGETCSRASASTISEQTQRPSKRKTMGTFGGWVAGIVTKTHFCQCLLVSLGISVRSSPQVYRANLSGRTSLRKNQNSDLHTPMDRAH